MIGRTQVPGGPPGALAVRVRVVEHEPADADDVALGLGIRGDTVKAAHGSEAGVVAGQREVDRVPGQALVGPDGGKQLAHEAGLAGDRVGRTERVADAVGVPVDALAGPGAGHELSQALGPDRADGVGVPAGLGVQLRGQQRGGDARARLRGPADERLVLAGDGTWAQDTGAARAAPRVDRGVGSGVGRDPAAEQHRQQDDAQHRSDDDHGHEGAHGRGRGGLANGERCSGGDHQTVGGVGARTATAMSLTSQPPTGYGTVSCSSREGAKRPSARPCLRECQ